MSLTVSPQVYVGGTWTFPPMLQEAGIDINQGYTARGKRRPSSLAMRINNDDDTWRPSSPLSPMYADGGRNLPAAVVAQSNVRAWMEAGQWAPDMDPEFQVLGGGAYTGRRWVDLAAYGVQSRIGAWADNVESTMYRQFTGLSSLIGLWPLEDTSGTTSIFNAAGGPSPAPAAGWTFGQDDTPAGASSSLKVAGGTKVLFGDLVPTTTGYQVFISAKLPPLTANYQTIMWWRDSNYLYAWEAATGGYRIHVLDSGAELIAGTSTFGGSVDPVANWVSYRIKVSTSSGNLKVEPAWYQQGDPNVFGITATAAGAAGRLQYQFLDVPAGLDGMLLSFMGAVSDPTEDLQSFAVLQGFNAFAGETAGARFTRLCAEAGIPSELIGAAADTVAMGPQKPDTFDNLFDEIQASEDALIFDRVSSGIGLALRTRADRYNQAAALTLAFTDILPSMPEDYSTTGVENNITIKNRDGRQAVAIDTTSTMSVADPPAGVSEIRATYNTNISSDDDLANAAAWYLTRGTIAGSRYPTVTVDLGAAQAAGNTTLVTAVTAVRPGDRIIVTGRDYDDIDVQVIGWSEKITVDEWTVTFACVPNDPFNVGAYDDGVTRYAFAASTVNSSMTTTSTGLNITTPDPFDTVGSADLPYDVMVGGERMTVTVVGARTGTGPYVTATTVTRSVNGVVKTQANNTPVQVANPGRYAW